ncbi:probable transcription factor GLK1 isoform X1 [Musa acuminata AAA Group]|uniref:probable transcription factor GLK1 isoform X1 n=1 Tax=Musa acuminata AAA Group TaxID=214697 RepID=UPI0031DD7284
MLAVEPLRGSNGDEREGAMGSLAVVDDFVDGSLFEDISFGDLFVGMDDGDVLPDLELDPAEILVEFSGAAEGLFRVDGATQDVVEEAEERIASHGVAVASGMAEEDPILDTATEVWSASPEGDRGRKSSAAAASMKGSQGKRKAKVEWTPELHRRFVQAVEQLGIDKAVPSRILELMGIDCLTRHNIASHLQKYRSHRKSLLARQAEAASWSQRRQMYAAGTGAKRGANPWLAPTVVLPPPPAQAFRPLHVWGHPAAAEPPLVHMWPFPPPPDPPYWHYHFQRGSREGWVTMTQGTPCLPQPMAAAGFAAPHLAGIVPHPMDRPVPPPPPMSKQQESTSQLQLDAAHPTKECIDAAIGDVLAKPWLPLPLRLKPPSLDSVLAELQKQGVSKVPPASG